MISGEGDTIEESRVVPLVVTAQAVDLYSSTWFSFTTLLTHEECFTKDVGVLELPTVDGGLEKEASSLSKVRTSRQPLERV
jgi:hypothetical protein